MGRQPPATWLCPTFAPCSDRRCRACFGQRVPGLSRLGPSCKRSAHLLVSGARAALALLLAPPPGHSAAHPAAHRSEKARLNPTTAKSRPACAPLLSVPVRLLSQAWSRAQSGRLIYRRKRGFSHPADSLFSRTGPWPARQTRQSANSALCSRGCRRQRRGRWSLAGAC